jgi:hypothetical protein
MATWKPGDRVICRVRHHRIVSTSALQYEEEKVFEIVGVDSNGYFLYVPDYYHLRDTVLITKITCVSLNILERFVDSQMIYILSSYVVGMHSELNGCLCKQCGEFYFFAQPNRGDGTLVCWSCRADPYRR